MMTLITKSLAHSLSLIALASCTSANSGDSTADSATTGALQTEAPDWTMTEVGTFDEPWAIEFAPGTQMLFITEKSGTLKVHDAASGRTATVGGTPQVDYGGQGGLGDIAFLPSEAGEDLSGRTIYLSWAEAGEGDTRGAVVGRGTLTCEALDCSIEGLDVIWRQMPKVTGRGHYSHRMQISPDGQYLFVASGDRQKQDPAQDLSNTLGTIVRLNLDGTPAAGNPFADRANVPDEIWSYGHRNILGMDFGPDGRLWEIEHGPAGGDELNLVERGENYGWPERSYGDNYNGTPIPEHTADDGFNKPETYWTPVIAPGDMIIYSGDMFDAWAGDALIANLKVKNIVRVDIDGDRAQEVARYEFRNRLRSIEEGPDGAIWVAEDGDNARLLKLSR
ncbi:PQQ-dependent sugar dehydrogenase [Erythrobacter sp.]|uniref:PQQ-dependent sugar dehydrogenase n=1 Tax=Erythrobacter sp. TaxID=1042 RepID=UPI003C713246